MVFFPKRFGSVFEALALSGEATIFPLQGFQTSLYFIAPHNSIKYFYLVVLKQHFQRDCAIFHLALIQIVWDPFSKTIDLPSCLKRMLTVSCDAFKALTNCSWVWIGSSCKTSPNFPFSHFYGLPELSLSFTLRSPPLIFRKYFLHVVFNGAYSPNVFTFNQ